MSNLKLLQAFIKRHASFKVDIFRKSSVKYDVLRRVNSKNKFEKWKINLMHEKIELKV